jgi:integrase
MKGFVYKRCPCGTIRDPNGKRINCQKKHGSWAYVHEGPVGSDGKRKQQTRGGFRTEREARAKLNDALSALVAGTYIEPTKITVGEYLDEWLKGKAALRSTSRRSYTGHVHLYLKPGLGHLRLDRLTDENISDLYAAMRQLGHPGVEPGPILMRMLAARSSPEKARPLRPATIRRVHATLRSALNSAVRRKKIGSNPAKLVELEAGRRPRAVVWTPERVRHWQLTGERPTVAVWTPEHVGEFLDAIADERLYPLFHLIAYRGLRRGEAVGLRWMNLDLEGRLLRVTQQVVQVGWATEIGEPKTDSGERAVTLDAGTAVVLDRWREAQASERAAWGSRWLDNGLVFTAVDGSQLHPDLVTDAFQRLADAAGLPPIRLHDLRHTAASLALQAGVPLKVVSDQLGHSSLAITADTYTSVLPAVAAAAAEAVAGIVPRAPRPDPASRPVSNRAQIRQDAAALADGLQNGSNESERRSKNMIDSAKSLVSGLADGGPRGARTHNPRIKSPLLCRLS